MSITVVHIAFTPLAGSPIRIVNALNRHTSVRARLVVLNPNVYDQRKFDGDLVWGRDKEEILKLLRETNLIHLHHFFELESNPFGINFTHVAPQARFVRQFHTHPLTIARGQEAKARQVVDSTIPQLVIAQYHERFFPRARLVPNIVPLSDKLYRPVPRVAIDPVVFFAPTVDYSAVGAPSGGTRWETKGASETEALLSQIVEACGKGRITVRRNIPHEQCLRERQACDISIDEMVTGSFHLSSLEALAQGLPTFAYLDARSLETLSEFTGTVTNPWLNFRLEDAGGPLSELIKDDRLRREMGESSRKWMENYYNDREMIKHYVRAYEDLIERPESFQTQRFDDSNHRQIFLAQGRDDLVWESRRLRINAANNVLHVKLNHPRLCPENHIGGIPNWIKAPVHDLIKKYTSVRVDEIQALERRLKATEELLKVVSANETNRWLYQNRLQRMDATLEMFDQQRREFHLDRYRFAAKQVQGKRVLDCACGTGYGSRMLRENGGAAFVIGVDIEPTAIEYACRKHEVDGTTFICSSGDCLALPNASVDVVTSFETIEHVSDDVALINEFHRVLRPYGFLIISTPNLWPLAHSPHHIREYDRASFIKVLDQKFACVELYNQNSGSDTPLNRCQASGFVLTTPENENVAECYLAVCRCR